MENIIKKAIEGGGFTMSSYYYKSSDKMVKLEYFMSDLGIFVDENGFKHRIHYGDMFMQPSFWQALGKACGWTITCSRCGRQMESKYRESNLLVCWCCMEDAGEEKETWLYNALRFHEINLTESWEKAVEYLQEVTK